MVMGGRMLVLQWRNSEVTHAMDGKLVGQRRPDEGNRSSTDGNGCKQLTHEKAHGFIPSSSSFHTAHVPTWHDYQSEPWCKQITKLLVLYSTRWID
jgi:hypothetical protein